MLRARLLALRDDAYADFQRRLLPTVKKEAIIGVPTPQLRTVAREMRGTAAAERFLSTLPHESFEENQLHAFLINDVRDPEEALHLVEAFLPYIDNWATCDQLRPRVFSREKEKLLQKIEVWIGSERPYTVRFGLEMLMLHFMDEGFDRRYLAWAAQVQSDEYYVRMMVAWYFATALTKQYEAALPYMEERRLPAWTHAKAIQKALESRCISADRKAYLRSLKGRRNI